MSWIVSRSDLFEEIRAQYESRLDEQLDNADSDTSIYWVQRNFEKWTEFRHAVEEYESCPCDPALKLRRARYGLFRIQGVYWLRRERYNALYSRFLNPPQAIAFLLYHDHDRDERIRQLLDYPPYR
jgi:hypothetical protein